MFFKRALFQLMLAALLLAAQQVALTHEVWHLKDRLPDQSQQRADGQQTTQSDWCPFHASFADVLGGLGSNAAPLAVNTDASTLCSYPLPASFSGDLIVPASRGPPSFL